MGPLMNQDPRNKKTVTSDGKSNSICEFKQMLKTVKDPLKPLRYRSFYLDLKDYKGLHDLKEDIILLGGVLENFISKEVSCVVTNKPLNKPESSGFPGANQNIHSPIFSPATDSPGTSDTPLEEHKKKVMSRGNRMLEKAIRVVKGTGDVLQNAQKWGVQVVSLPRFLSWLETFKTKHNIKKNKNDKKKRVQSRQDKSVIHLMEPFIKFEAVSRQYRPVYKQLRKWPELVFDLNSCSSPFSHTTHSVDRRKQASTHRSARSEHEVNRKEQSNRPSKGNIRDKKQLNFKRKHGYCEICSIPYTNLFKHLETSQHQKFVCDERNYARLDKVIASGRELSDYLEAVKLDSSADEVKLLTPVDPRIPSTGTIGSHDKSLPEHAINLHPSYTPEKPVLESVSSHKNGEAQISRDLFPSIKVSCVSWDHTDKGAMDSDANKLNISCKDDSYSGSCATLSASLPGINQNTNASACTSDQKAIEHSNELLVSRRDVNVDAVGGMVTPIPQMEREKPIEPPTVSHAASLFTDEVSLELVDSRPTSYECVSHITHSDMQKFNNCNQPSENGCVLNNKDCEDACHQVEVNETIHKTLRSTVHKRIYLSQQVGDKAPLDLSMGKRECSKESSPVSKPHKMPKLDISCAVQFSNAEADLPSASMNKNVEAVLTNVTDANEGLCLNSSTYSPGVNLCNSINLSAESTRKPEMLVCHDETVKYPTVPIESTGVKMDSSEVLSCGSKPRSVLVLTDHSVRTLFNSDTDASDFLGFGTQDYQDLPLDLSYTEMPESNGTYQSAPSSEKECSLSGNCGMGTNHASECTLSSVNDETDFSESNQDVLLINGDMYRAASDSSEPWDHEVKLFLDKHVTNTAVVK